MDRDEARRILEEIQTYSNDPKTKTASFIEGCPGVGASNRILPPVPKDRSERLHRSLHCEIRTIGEAARDGFPLDGETMWITGTSCLPCAKAIIAAGITTVRIIDEMDAFKDRLEDPAYDFPQAMEVFRLAGVKVERV